MTKLVNLITTTFTGAAMLAAAPTAGLAQTSGPLGGLPAAAAGTAPVAVITLGDGVHSGAGQPVAQVGGGAGTPLIGVGALSPGVHDGSAASISLANSARLLGVSAGPVAADRGVTVFNPTGRPIFAPR